MTRRDQRSVGEVLLDADHTARASCRTVVTDAGRDATHVA